MTNSYASKGGMDVRREGRQEGGRGSREGGDGEEGGGGGGGCLWVNRGAIGLHSQHYNDHI